MILYLIGGRGFTRKNTGRKLYEVVECFNRVEQTDVVFGGDIPKEMPASTSISAGKAAYYSKWYRKNKFMLFFSESYSELKSIWHNHITYKYLLRKDANYQLVWERSSALHNAGLRYAKRMKLPSVLEWKDHLVKDYPSLFKFYVKWMEKWKLKNADYIAVESEVLKEQLVMEGVDSAKIYVTYNAVNPDEFVRKEESRKRCRVELGIDDNDTVVGYVGSYAFYHDSKRMILAAKELKDKGLTHIKWVLVGDGKDKQECVKLAEEYGLINNIVYFVNNVRKELVPQYLSSFDFAILPGSTDIICPIKVMEYMAANCITLVPDYACNREVINDRVNGILFAPYNESSISSAIEMIDKDPETMARIGTQARQYVVDNLTWDNTYGKVLRLLLSKAH